MNHSLTGIVAAVSLAILISCKKDSGLGGDLLPRENQLGLEYEETDEILVSTILEHPLRTDRMFFNYIGHLESPVFGRVTARSFVEVSRPASIPADSLGPYTLNGIVLNLFYEKYFGDTTEPITWEVFKVDNSPVKTVLYNSDYVPGYSRQKLGALSNYLVKPNTPVKFSESDTTAGRVGLLQIRLENFLGFSFINHMASETLKRDSLFWNFFPGLYIQPSSAQPGKVMLQMNYTDLAGGIYVYLKDRNGKDATMVFPIATSTFYHTGFEHDYAGSVIQSVLNSTQAGSEKAYIQSQAGVKTWVQFPNIEKYKGKLINKAVLEFYEVDTPAINTPRPRNIFPLKRGADEKNEAILDYSSSFYGPARIDTSMRDDVGRPIIRYQMNISNYFKDLVFGKNENKGIHLTNYPIFDQTPGFIFNQGNIVQSQYVEPSSVVIGGPAYPDPARRMKLKVWYSLPK